MDIGKKNTTTLSDMDVVLIEEASNPGIWPTSGLTELSASVSVL